MTNSSMILSTYSYDPSDYFGWGYGEAEAHFSGRFIASTPFLKVTYNYSRSISNNDFGAGDWLTISHAVVDIYEYRGDPFSYGSGTVYIPTGIGNEIYIDVQATIASYQFESASLIVNYSFEAVGSIDYYCDSDADGYYSSYISGSCPTGVDCVPAGCQTSAGNDCNDGNSQIHPGAPEVCNDADDNCDGNVDEGLPISSWYFDYDGDSYGNPSVWQDKCDQPAGGWVADNTDCNDNDANIYPGGPEVRIESPLAYYWISQLQTAYSAAGDGSTIQSMVATYTGNLTIDQNKTIIIDGGYDCGYSTATGKTTVLGNMTISNGQVTIGNVQVQ
jgi:hypothetical protein